MNSLDWLTLRVPPEALGKSADEHRALLTALLEEGAALSEGKNARMWALAELYGLEAQFISRQLSSGSGAEGSFSRAELSARLARAIADRDAARAEFARLRRGRGQASKAARGSGSVPITFEG